MLPSAAIVLLVVVDDIRSLLETWCPKMDRRNQRVARPFPWMDRCGFRHLLMVLTARTTFGEFLDALIYSWPPHVAPGKWFHSDYSCMALA